MATKVPAPERFPTLRELAQSPLLRADKEFLAAYTTPVLLLQPPRQIAGPGEESTEIDSPDAFPAAGFQTLHGFNAKALSLTESYNDAQVAPLKKSDRNTFAQMITLGRALNNDLVLPAGTVSKLHGYFMNRPQGGLAFYDAGSKNGTSLNGNKVTPRTRIDIEDGFEFLFGSEIRALYKLPLGLLELAKAAGKKL